MMKTAKWSPYLYVAPSLVIAFIFVYYPVLQNLQSSFYSWSPFSDSRDFIGLANYKRLLDDNVFLVALKNNAIHMVISLLVQVGGGLILAAILEDVVFRRVAPLLRTVYFLPVLISISVIGLLFTFIYNPEIGLLNQFLRMIGLGSLATGWLGNSETAFYAVVAMGQWQGIGYITMLYIVAIQKIAPDLYEAAKIDGAGKVQSFLHITVPQVKEMTFVTVIIAVSQSILTFSDVYVLTAGGPGYSSQVLSTYLYQKAFVDNEMGYASTLANVILGITFIIFMIQTKVFKSGGEG
ncbi:carbohydrate ABC transporter permease [Ammoniphilus sp. YIM 78166]|uniref:carbohydrate ABC transporter permease n=1 Tax=Ammoniphilus sp. YIM 78166 TaxID=1644106 RepID=UPI001F0D8248|nr:sugar ABC transporter permease [Ammoniphilus sp. YIM 78166]